MSGSLLSLISSKSPFFVMYSNCFNLDARSESFEYLIILLRALRYIVLISAFFLSLTRLTKFPKCENCYFFALIAFLIY